jgi:hypothetical protein
VGIKQRGYDYAMMVSVAGLNPRAVRVLDVGTCSSGVPPCSPHITGAL